MTENRCLLCPPSRDPYPVVRAGMCQSCLDATQRRITELPELYVGLYTALARQQTGLGEHVSGSHTPPTPIRVDIHDLMIGTVAYLVELEVRVREVARLAEPVASNDAAALARACRLLTNHSNVLFALNDAGEHAAAIHQLHKQARSILGHTRLTHQLPAPCPRCDLLTLVRENGADNVHCQNCYITYPEADYQRLCLVLASDHREGART